MQKRIQALKHGKTQKRKWWWQEKKIGKLSIIGALCIYILYKFISTIM